MLKSVSEAIIFSLPIMGFILLAKWVMINFIPAFYGHNLFDLGRTMVETDLGNKHLYLLLPLLYAIISTPIQEILFRGGLQGLLQSFLVGKYRFLLAIIVSNLIFGIIHLVSASEGFVIVTLFLGIFWGWLYQRHASLVGVIISHMLIGVWAFFIVGIEIIIHTLDLFP